MHINQDFAQSVTKSPVRKRSLTANKSNPRLNKSGKQKNINQDDKLLQETIVKIEGAYAPSTIRAYRADFANFIGFCHKRNATALPAEPNLVVQYISKLTESGRSSASIRRALCGLSAIHRLNRLDDPSKDPDVNLEMRRMHRRLGRSAKQALGINADLLDKLLLATFKTFHNALDTRGSKIIRTSFHN